MVSEEERKELEKIKKMNNQPKNEEKLVPVIQNNNQHKIAIPKKFTDYLGYKKADKKAKVILDKKEKKLIIEVK